MNEKLLERVMLQFFHHEADVLLASAIIQSGLDISNANTILVDRADLFGLAQLYQLRGRVGRGGQQAFAYLFIPNEETLNTDEAHENGRKRFGRLRKMFLRLTNRTIIENHETGRYRIKPDSIATL